MLLESTTFRKICRARGILAEPRRDSPTIPELACEVGISPFHLIRQFRATFGVTPHQFRIAARVERAKRLLATRALPVTDVCLEVGFSSLGSFSDLFKRRVGIAPSEYGRRMRSMIVVPGQLPPLAVPGCLNLMERLPVGRFAVFEKRALPTRG